MARRLPRLPKTGSARQLAKDLVSSGVVPATKEADALQMAVSAAHEMDYLLTWNYAHLANPVAQEHLEAVCRRFELRAPLVVSPEMIPQHRLGQQIWRRKPNARVQVGILPATNQGNAQPRWANDADAQAFLREAEALIEGDAAKPRD